MSEARVSAGLSHSPKHPGGMLARRREMAVEGGLSTLWGAGPFLATPVMRGTRADTILLML